MKKYISPKMTEVQLLNNRNILSGSQGFYDSLWVPFDDNPETDGSAD